MSVLLVNPPLNWRDASELAPPMGLLVLKRAVERRGIHVALWDGNLESVEHPARTIDDWHDLIVGLVRQQQPQVVGLTSMVANSHVALQIGQAVRQEAPSAFVVLGGSHFSAFAEECLAQYPWIDAVVRGEGERSFADLVEWAQSDRDAVPPRGTVVRGSPRPPAAATRQPLSDSLIPVFEGVELARYFRANPRRKVDYESARGCVFNCSFCYSPVQWPGKPRYRAVEAVVRDLAVLQERGARHVFFVDDNFLNDESRVIGLCEALARAELGVTWNCYATINQLTPAIIDALAKAGCVSVFIGIDAVEPASQSEFRKRFFRSFGEVSPKLRACLRVGIRPTCSLIFRPTADEDEWEASARWAMRMRRLGCEVRLNALARYQGTPLYGDDDEHGCEYSSTRVRLMLDTPPIVHENPFAQRSPEFFPYHCSSGPRQSWERFMRTLHALGTLVRHFPDTLRALAAVEHRIWRVAELTAERASGGRGDRLRERERGAFTELVPVRSRSRPVRRTLHLETLRAEVERMPAWRDVEVETEGRPRQFEIRSFVLAQQEAAVRRRESLNGARWLVVGMEADVVVYEVGESLARGLAPLAAASKSVGRAQRGLGTVELGWLLQEGIIRPVEGATPSRPRGPGGTHSQPLAASRIGSETIYEGF